LNTKDHEGKIKEHEGKHTNAKREVTEEAPRRAQLLILLSGISPLQSSWFSFVSLSWLSFVFLRDERV
jgi:hypothetical protein